MKILYEFLSSIEWGLIFGNKEPEEFFNEETLKKFESLKYDKVVEIVFGREVKLNDADSEENKLKLNSYFDYVPDDIKSIKPRLEEILSEVNEINFEVVEFNSILDYEHLDSFFDNLIKNEPLEAEKHIFFSAQVFPFSLYMLFPDIMRKYNLQPHPFMVDSMNEFFINDSNAFELTKNIMIKHQTEIYGETIDPRFDKIFTANEDFMSVKWKASVAAKTNIEILLFGESGTGKELFARAIHEASERKGRFVPINCAALAPEILESELFGHEKGSFTGAIKQKKGIFELAKEGTVFLDEVAEMSLEMQAKLLRSLESRTIKRVGGEEEINIDVRIISATNKDLYAEVQNKNFRKDLYFRLRKFELDIPPLRERGPLDIALLTLKVCNERKYPASHTTEPAGQILRDYDYPGNVRELFSIIECAIILSNIYKKDIDEQIIIESIGKGLYKEFEERRTGTSYSVEEKLRNNRSINIMKQYIGDVNFHNEFNLEDFLQEVEKHYIKEALREYKTQKQAGKALGYTQQRLSNRIKKLKLTHD